MIRVTQSSELQRVVEENLRNLTRLARWREKRAQLQPAAPHHGNGNIIKFPRYRGQYKGLSSAREV